MPATLVYTSFSASIEAAEPSQVLVAADGTLVAWMYAGGALAVLGGLIALWPAKRPLPATAPVPAQALAPI